MRLEDVLSEIGDSPLNSQEGTTALVAFINSALLKSSHPAMETTITGDDALAVIYSLDDDSVKNALLNKEFKAPAKKDSYKLMLNIFAGTICTAVIAVMLIYVMADKPMNADTADVMKIIWNGIFDIIKMIVHQVLEEDL